MARGGLVRSWQQDSAGEEAEEAAAAGGAEEAEVLLLEHFPASETSAEASNEGGDAELPAAPPVRMEYHRGARGGLRGHEEAGAAADDDMERARALAAAAEAAVAAAEAAARVVRLAALRRLSREERAAVRIQAYYRGYLVRSTLACPATLIVFVYVFMSDYLHLSIRLALTSQC